jgi:hypothetical protein
MEELAKKSTAQILRRPKLLEGRTILEDKGNRNKDP